MSQITQTCPTISCAHKVSYDTTTAPGTKLACPDGHDLVVAACPATEICPTKRLAILASSLVGERLQHRRCRQLLEITSMSPVPTLKLVHD